jgi:hypothetical protein
MKKKALYAPIDEAAAVAIIAHFIDLMRDVLTPEASRAVLRDRIRWMVRSGAIPTIYVIGWARAGHEDADRALRELAVEMISRRQEMPTELAAFVQEALVMTPVIYPGGQNIASTWLRNVVIAVLVKETMARSRVKRTRNRTTAWPSACSLVSAALVAKGINVGEDEVDRIFRENKKLARQTSASWSPP